MLNNGHMSGGMGPADNHGMYHGGRGPHGGGGGGHPGNGGGQDYGGGGGANGGYLHSGPPPPPNGMMGHHSGGICSQMTLNQNHCPPNTHQCGGCGGPIMERYLLQALERYWHHMCLKCSCCGGTLADLGPSCYTRDGMILCRNDYQRIFCNGGACQGCGQGIPPSELVMRAGAPPPGSSPPFVYHMVCFKCSKCGVKLVQGDRYSLLNGALFCEQDALKFMKNGIGSPSNANVATTNGPTPAPRKGKVGRPRRSRD